MKKWLRSLIHYPHIERGGLFILLLFILGFVFIVSTIPFIEQKKYSRLIQISTLPFDSNIYQSRIASTKGTVRKIRYKKLKRKTDPNLLNEKEWMQMGLSEKQARSLITYRNKINGFYSIDDLEKCYTLPEAWLDMNRNMLIFSTKKITNTTAQNKNSNFIGVIKLNSSDSAAWTKLPGITPKLAGRIIRYRNRLGAFHHPTQLLDVYGMNPDIYEKIKTQIDIDSGKKIQISLNYATYAEFKKLPYLDHESIKQILLHREKSGFFKDKKELVNNMLINEEIYFKIAPYLVL